MTSRPPHSMRSRTLVGISLLAGAVPVAVHVRADIATASTPDVRSAAIATEVAVRSDPPSPTPTAGPVEPSLAVTAVELTNQRRAAAGRPPLSVDGALSAAAVQHSADQAARDRLGHIGSDGSNVRERIARNGGSFGAWSEIIAAGYPSALTVVDAWMDSFSHRRNMLNSAFTRVGVGTAVAADGTRYWTMVLAG